MSTVDEILTSFDSMLDVVVEIDSTKRSDGSSVTWKYSYHGKDEIAAPAYLKSVGPLSQALAEDLQFSGLAQSDPGTVVLTQTVLDNDGLSQLLDYEFDQHEIRVLIGVAANAYATFARYRTTTVLREPDVKLTRSGLVATFRLAGSLAGIVSDSLRLKRHVGIPTCVSVLTTSAVASASYIAAYSLTSFTISYRIKVATLPASTRTFLLKSSGGTNQNYFLQMNTSGFILAGATVSGVSTIFHTGSVNHATDDWITIVWGLQDKTYSYLMVSDGIDPGTIESEYTPAGSVDTQTAAFQLVRGLIGKHCEIVLYDHYKAPSEMRSLISSRVDSTVPGIIGLWVCDDNLGSTINDYSASANDAAITGTENTDWKWDLTDLGEAALAGTLMPCLQGNVLNAKAHLIDGARERHRANLDAVSWHTSGSNTSVVVRSRGTVLTGGGTDYTLASDGADGVFPTTSQEDEPITFDILNNGTSEEYVYPSYVAHYLLLNRTSFASGDINERSYALLVLCPWLSGYRTEQEASIGQALQSILGGAGLCYYEDRDGKLTMDFLLQPVGYGPYGEPAMDFNGGVSNHWTFGDVGDITGSMTICGWFYTSAVDQTAYELGGTEPNLGTCYIGAKANTGGNYALYFQTAGANAGQLCFRVAGTTIRGGRSWIKRAGWYFGAGTFDAAADIMKLYVGWVNEDESVIFKELTSASNTGTPTTNSDNFLVGADTGGCPWFGVQHVQVYNTVKTQAQLEALLATPPDLLGLPSDLKVYVPFSEGSGSPVERTSSTTGIALSTSPGMQWAPRLVIDLDLTPSVELAEFRRTVNPSGVIVKYARNHAPMTDADIDAGVSQLNRIALVRPDKEVSLGDPDNLDRRITIDSPITDQESAHKLAQAVQSRLAAGQFIGSLRLPSGLATSRAACGLLLGQEIGISASIPSQLSTPRSFRVIAVQHDPITLSTTIAFWGGTSRP